MLLHFDFDFNLWKIKMKKMICLFLYLLATSANAGLMLNIYEDTNNDVVFEFSGSDVVNQGSNNYTRNGFWFGDITDTIYSGASGVKNAITDSFFATNTTQGTNSTLDDLYLSGASGHKLGIRLNNSSILTSASNGDLITWSGQAIFDLDISDFMTGTWTGDRLIANGTDELILLGGGYTINIGPTDIPEPTSIALLGLVLVGIGFSRKKKTA